MAESNNGTNVGRVEQVTGVVVDAVFPDHAAGDLLGGEDRDRRRRRRRTDRAGLRGAAAPRRRPRARGRDGRHRRHPARRQGDRHRRPDHGPGRRRHPGPDLQPARRTDRRRRGGRDRGALADPPPGPGGLRPDPDPGDPRDRDQGHRPARALRQRRQGRAVRRRRRRQDRADPGADPQHRRGARGAVRLRRRRRALARGQRPLARDEGVGRDRQDDARLRPDERAPRRPPARRPLGADDGRVLPRAGRPGRAALHRQHLPLRPGGLGGLGAARPNALRGRLPADAGDRDGRNCRSGSPRPSAAR